MALDFGEYIRSYSCSGDSDGTEDEDDEVSQLLKLNVDHLYYDVDDMAKLLIPGHKHRYTTINPFKYT